MLNLKKTLLAAGMVAPAIALSACATNFDVDGVSAMPDKGDAFAAALHKRYIERAKFEVGEGNWMSVDYFTAHAEAAAMGNTPALSKPGDWRLKKDQDAIAAAYGRLSAALGTNAPKVAPDACARAQTWLEHWMEQSAEGHQPDHIAWTRGEYERAIPDCVAGKPMMAKPATVPGPFDVFFDFNSDKLDSQAMVVVSAVVSAAKSYGPQTIYVRGHTDRSGNAEYNTRLAKSRAMAVKNAIAAGGIKASVDSSSYGEGQARVKTDDEVRHPLNRRVEITFKMK